MVSLVNEDYKFLLQTEVIFLPVIFLNEMQELVGIKDRQNRN